VSSPVAGALEIGGTHVTAARIDVTAREVEFGTLRRLDLPHDGTRDVLLAVIRDAALGAATHETRRWGVAVPGPFDYERGICTIEGVAKLDALYGVDLRTELSSAIGVEPASVRFLNDADAFLFGEWWAGVARGHNAAMGVTLGTGLGSAFLRDGTLLTEGEGVPPDARLDLIRFRGGTVEDVLSRRGLLAAYRRAGGRAPDVAEIAARAQNGDAPALAAFRAFGAALGEFLTPWIQRFAPTGLVFGGGIARSWPLFGDAFEAACLPAASIASTGVAARLDEAPLLGAARHAIDNATIGRSSRRR
jgi:glucokinase